MTGDRNQKNANGGLQTPLLIFALVVLALLLGGVLYDNVTAWRETYDGIVANLGQMGVSARVANPLAGLVMLSLAALAFYLGLLALSRTARDSALSVAAAVAGVVLSIAAFGGALWLIVKFVKWAWYS